MPGDRTGTYSPPSHPARTRSARIAREEAVSLLRPPPSEGVERDDEVMEALAALTVQQRAVVVLTYWADLAPADAAQLLGVSTGSVKKQLSRARRKLRGALSDER